jgi:hypothetical protein
MSNTPLYDVLFNAFSGLVEPGKKAAQGASSSPSSKHTADLSTNTDDKLKQMGYDNGASNAAAGISQSGAIASYDTDPLTGAPIPKMPEGEPESKDKNSDESVWGPAWNIDPISGSPIKTGLPSPTVEDVGIEQLNSTSLPKSQMEEYYDWLASTPEGQHFAEQYAQYTGDLGYSALRASGDKDAWSYLLGLQGNDGIGNWKNRYSLSGVDLSDEETAADNLYDYLYGDAIDVGARMRGDPSIKLSNDYDSTGELARYLYENYGYRPTEEMANKYNLDADDVALIAMASQATNSRFNSDDARRLQKQWEKAGGKGKFKIVGDETLPEYASAQASNPIDKVYSSDLDQMVFDEAEEGRGKTYDDASMAAAMINAYGRDPRNKGKLILL